MAGQRAGFGHYSRREFLALGAAAVTAGVTTALGCAPAGAPAPGSQAPAPTPAYPTKQVLIVVPFSAGGGTDVMTRNIVRVIEQEKLVPVQITVENRTGGDGAVGHTYALSRPADGYTLIASGNSVVYLPVTGEVPWTWENFTYIARMVSDYNMLIVRADSQFRTLADLVDSAKRNPKTLKIGGTGSGPLVTDVMAQRDFSKATGTETVYVPFSGGGEVMTNLLGGHIDAAWANPNECIAQLEAKQVRPLGVTSNQRLKFLPEIPTMKEQGWDVYNDQYRSIIAPKGIPDYAVKYWGEILNKVRQSRLWREDYLQKSVLEDGWMGPEEFTEFMRQENERYQKLARELGLKR